MKQQFVNATMNDRRKGTEWNSHTTQFNPNRPIQAIQPDSCHKYAKALPVQVTPVVKKEEPSELDKMKAELMKLMTAADVKKPKKVSKSKLIGMAMDSAVDEPVKDYADVLAMLLAKK